MRLEDKIHGAFHHLIKFGLNEEAVWLLDKLIAEFPKHALSHYNRGVMAYDAGDIETARRHYERAAELAPDNFKIQASLAHFYHVGLEKVEEALTQYQNALALNPLDIETLTIAGHLSVQLRRFDQANQFYRKVLEIEPWHSDLNELLEKLQRENKPQGTDNLADDYYESAILKAQSGDIAGAIQYLEKAVENNPRHGLAHNDLGVLHYQMGNKDVAVRHYEEAARLDPDNAIFQKNLGDFYYAERGDVQAALEKYVEALRLNPEDTETLINTGQICLAVDKSDDARHFFQRALEIEPGNNDVRQLMDRLDSKIDAWNGSFDGRTSLDAAQEDNGAAVSDLERLLAQDPGNAMAYNDLGVLYYQSGQKNKAVECYEKAVELAPDQIVYQKNLADFYLMEQFRVEDAMKIYVKVLEKDPQDVECILAAGLVCAKMNNYPDARGFYQRALDIEPWNSDAQQALSLLDRTEYEFIEKNEAISNDALCAKQSAG
jgi:tetratricopeptide (TPR) repeat protein